MTLRASPLTQLPERRFGYGQLWTALFSFPLMSAVQLMCARLGMVTGLGLAGVVRRRVAMLLGLALNYQKFNAVRMLFWAPVLNGVLAPPLVALVTLLSSDKKLMGERARPPLLQILGWAVTCIMSIATIIMVALWLRG